jgi:ferrous iron transport protein B
MTEPLTADCTSCPAHHLPNLIKLGVDMEGYQYVVALAGNPNTGKSTVFNALTGLRQHTGNWPGKTVARAEGGFSSAGDRYKLVDLPGTYSLLSASLDEEIARDFILFGKPDVTVIIVDATRLERNLNLVLQVLEITDRVVVCLNLMDEARRRGLTVDERRLARDLGVPVVPTAARFDEGLDELLAAIREVATGETVCKPHRIGGRSPALKRAVNQLSKEIYAVYPELANPQWVALRLLDGDPKIVEAVRSGALGELEEESAAIRPDRPEEAEEETRGSGPADHPVLAAAHQLRWHVGKDFHQKLMESIYAEAARIADRSVTRSGEKPRFDLDRAIDRVVTSRILGFPIMLALLTLVFWITIAGANMPSQLLARLLLDNVHPLLKSGAAAIGLPWWLDGLLIDGLYLATAWVVSVMLPPMAIFFPLFTLLEDFGYLPRVAFNLDRVFHRVGAHGKQALTMAMGWGCNAAAIVSTRVIDSPRERLIAIITNNFALCNGRWPTQILIASIFIGGLVPAYLAGFVSALSVVAIAVLGVVLTFATSWLLSRTILRGEVSTFDLELPPYRPPRVLQTLYTSVIDRTLIVLPSLRPSARPIRRNPPRLRDRHSGQRDRHSDYPDAHRSRDRHSGRRRRNRGHVRTRVRGRYGPAPGSRRLDAVDGGEPDALQPCPQPVLDDHLHHLEGNPERQVDRRLGTPSGRDGPCDLFRGGPGVADRGGGLALRDLGPHPSTQSRYSAKRTRRRREPPPIRARDPFWPARGSIPRIDSSVASQRSSQDPFQSKRTAVPAPTASATFSSMTIGSVARRTACSRARLSARHQT